MNMDITPFLPLITGAVGGAASVGLFKGPIQTFQDWWYVSFGHQHSETAAMLKEKKEINVQKLRDETLKETSKILPENIREPQLNILGPALEASKYYIEDDELRSMFSKLIAASMDNSKLKIAHPSFVEVIKQMSTLDAHIFDLIIKNDQTAPIARLGIAYPVGHRVLYDNLFPITLDEENMAVAAENKFIGPSIENLKRLGLVDANFTLSMTDKDSYDFIADTLEYRNIIAKIEALNELEANSENRSMLHSEYGVVSITPFGKAFAYICLGIENSFNPF